MQRYARSLTANTLPIWHLIASVKRALVGLEHGHVYDNLKAVADVLANLNRSAPPLEASVVREGQDIARRIKEVERLLLGTMIDVQNLFVVLEHEGEERHDVSDHFASSGYGPHFHKIVECVDALDEGLKKIPQAKAALEQLKHLIEKDPDVAALPGLNKYAPAQHVEALERELDKAEKALGDLSWQYDDSNKAFLRMGLR